MNANAAYWNQGVNAVPAMTGAASLMDGADIREHAARLGFALPFESVIDVGCGTGRLAQFVSGKYVGMDIAEDAVAYCLKRGLTAALMEGPANLYWEGPPFSWVTSLSVFTHIDRPERQAYLMAFGLLAPSLLVDIIPGDGSGEVALWTADPVQFEVDLTATGWRIVSTYERVCPSGPTHRYYRCERVGNS